MPSTSTTSSALRQAVWAVALSLAIACGPGGQDAGQEPSADARADESAARIAQIEAPREPGSDGDAGKTLAELMETHGIPALSIAVVEDYRLDWAGAYGVADEASGAPADPGTLFQAASISKPVSAMAVLRAVQDGLFELDDDMNGILRSWQLEEDAELLAETPVTPRMLLSMTAGTTVSGFPGYKPGAELPTVPEVLGRQGQATPANTEPVVVAWRPGTRYEYSGGGSTILQLALSDVRDRPFQEILQETVLDPLGMTRSCFCQPLPAELHGNAARAGGSATGGDGNGAEGVSRVEWHVYPELYAAGLWTTPTDLASFLIEVQLSLEGRSNRILNAELTRKMVTPGGVGQYALGFTAGSTTPHRPAPPGERNRFFGHTGGNWGFRGNFVGSLDGGNGYVILANSSEANSVIFQELPARIRSAYGWESEVVPLAETEQLFQDRLDELREELGFIGATAAFVLPDGSEGSVATGHADPEHDVAMTPEHRMPAGSIGKTIAAATALSMVNEGLLGLDDPASRWLGGEPWWTRLPNHETMTLRHLLSHSSGLTDHVYDDAWRREARARRDGANADPDSWFRPRELVQFILDKEPLFPAGEGYAYTDTGFIVAGLMLEAASGDSYYDEARRRVLDRHDLPRTAEQLGRSFAGLAPGHLGEDNAFALPAKAAEGDLMAFNPRTEWAGGGYVSNSRDLARWAKILYEGKALDGPYLEEMLNSGYRGEDADATYGLGVYRADSPHGELVGHGGWFPGWRSTMYYHRDSGIAVAVQFNQNEADFGNRVRDDLLALLLELH